MESLREAVEAVVNDTNTRRPAPVRVTLHAAIRDRTGGALVYHVESDRATDLTLHMTVPGALEPLLMRHKVDLALWGHIHFAQRSCPMVNATCITAKDAAGYDAPIHAVIGNAGQGLTKFSPTRAAWSVYEASEWGFSHMTVHNATHLKLDYYADAPLDATAPIHHTATLVRAFPRV